MGSCCSACSRALGRARRNFSLDSVLAYSTAKVVKIQDRRLGILHILIQLLVVCYIIGYVFIYSRGYLKKEESQGLVATKVRGNAIGHWLSPVDRNPNETLIYVDEADLVYPPLDSGGVFIATKYQTTKSQRRSWCPFGGNVTLCDNNTQCIQDGFLGRCEQLDQTDARHVCKWFQWCPAEDDTTINNITTITELDDSVGDFSVWIKASIAFPGLDRSRLFSTIQHDEPITPDEDPQRANLFTLNELLARVPVAEGQSPISIHDVKDRGCILKVEVSWSCSLNTWNDSEACDIMVNVARLDNPQVGDGFNFRTSSYYYQNIGTINETKHRDLLKMYGIRLFVVSKGQGYKIDILTIVLQFSSGLAMLGIATIISDFLMLTFLPERKYYEKYKVLKTPTIAKKSKDKHETHDDSPASITAEHSEDDTNNPDETRTINSPISGYQTISDDIEG